MTIRMLSAEKVTAIRKLYTFPAHLAVIAMRQQQHEAILAQPLGLTAHQELVKDCLCSIGEIAKLRLPQHQRVWVF